MRVQLLSDLHFEFHADAGASFVAGLDPRGVDVLVLAGDIAVDDGIGPALDLFAARYPEALVLYVHGNHELYGSSREAVARVTAAAVARHRNVRWLDADVVEHRGVRFLGATLWFPHPGADEPFKVGMNDFHLIERFERWVYDDNARARAFFERELRPGDVVVTHHLPARASVAPEFEGSPLNAFFLCDLEPLIVERRPALWLHGHTHESVDTMVASTRVLCNPFGYARHRLNPAFREALFVECRTPPA